MMPGAGGTEESAESLSRQAWWVIAVLALGAAISYVDRQSLALVSEPLRHDLGFSDTQIGALYGGFAVFYAVASLPLAWVVDRFSRRHVIAWGVVVWAFATMSFGIVQGFFAMYLARILVGIGEASLVPATYSIFGDALPRSRLPFAMNLFHVGAVAGSGFAFVFGGWVVTSLRHQPMVTLPVFGDIFAWQLLFFYVGLPALILVPLLFTFKEPTRRKSESQLTGIPPGSWRGVWQFYRHNWQLVLLHHLGATSLLLLGYSFVFWTPSFFERVHGLAAEQASVYFGVIFVIAGVSGCIVSAWVSQRHYDRGALEAPLLIPMYCSLLLLPIIGLIQVVTSLPWIFALYVPAMFLINSPYGLLQGAMIQIAPPEIRARIAAVYMMFTALGNAVGPSIIGMLNDDAFPGADGIRYSMLVMCGVFGLGGVLMLAAAKGRFARRLAEVIENDKLRSRPA
ncbi:MAG: MFS transporter [Gammaproteobacteria bacterium]